MTVAARHPRTTVIASAALLIALLLFATSASAQGSPNANPFAQLGAGIQQLLADLTNPATFLAPFQSVSSGVAAKLVAPGLQLATALMVIKVLFLLVERAGKGMEAKSGVEIAVSALLPYIVCASLISAYVAQIGSLFAMPGWFVTNFGSGTQPGWSALFSALGNMFYKLLPAMSPFTAAGWSAIFMGVFCLGAIILVAWAFAEFMVAMVIGLFYFAIGASVGPLFLGAGVHQMFRNFTTAWFGFIMAAALCAGIGHLAANLASGMLGVITAKATAANGTLSGTDFVIVGLFSYTLVRIMGSIPAIANSLVPGGMGNVNSGGAAGAFAAISMAGGALLAGLTGMIKGAGALPGAPAAAQAAVEKGVGAAIDSAKDFSSKVSGAASAIGSFVSPEPPKPSTAPPAPIPGVVNGVAPAAPPAPSKGAPVAPPKPSMPPPKP
jgi:hypothetical protein